MKTTRIPSGVVPAPKSTLPPAAHGLLASMFANLAAKHGRLAGANKPDSAVAPLGAPDKAAINSQKGRGLTRQPVIGAPNDPNVSY